MWHLAWPKNSCGRAVIVLEETSEPFATPNFTLWVLVQRRKEQHIALALMIPLVMKMLYILY